MVSLAHVPRGRGALTAGIKVLKEPRKRPAYTRAQHPGKVHTLCQAASKQLAQI